MVCVVDPLVIFLIFATECHGRWQSHSFVVPSGSTMLERYVTNVSLPAGTVHFKRCYEEAFVECGVCVL